MEDSTAWSGAVCSPMWVRMRSTSVGSVMKATWRVTSAIDRRAATAVRRSMSVQGRFQLFAVDPAWYRAGQVRSITVYHSGAACSPIADIEHSRYKPLEALSQAVEDAAVLVGVAVERGAETAHEAHRPRLTPVAMLPGVVCRRWVSITRGEMWRIALTAFGSRSRYQRNRFGTANTHWGTGTGGTT